MATRYEENLLDIVVTLRRPGDYLESLLCVVYMRELYAELKRNCSIVSLLLLNNVLHKYTVL
jgi:hypothetical protein